MVEFCDCLALADPAGRPVVELTVPDCDWADTSDFTRRAMCERVCLRKWSLR